LAVHLGLRSGVGGGGGWGSRSEDWLTMPSPRALGLGLELLAPSLGDSAGDGFAILAELVEAAEAAGYGSVWLRGVSTGELGIDPVPVVGALVRRTGSLGLGVACTGGDGRHPAILARDLTTLDVLSGGRAALCLASPETGSDAAGRLTESAQICQLLFSQDGEAVTFSGVHFSVQFAVNRPPPEQVDGPPLLVELPAGAGAGFDALVAVVDGLVVDGPLEAVAAGRQRIDAATAASGIAGPLLVWRGSLADSDADWATLVEAVTAAGADSVIVRPGERSSPTAREVTEAAAQILPVLRRAA
jgi:alkanesulfonate monooxygenase SsuD/methylene tetrahydromethanopterin reductase-like flavin-dependent oxidoreductase (luciferase family)